MAISYYTNKSFYCASYPTETQRKELMQDGWIPTAWNKDTFYKESKVASYSSQIDGHRIKHIGSEPVDGNYSVHNHQYITDYFEVKRSDFDQMAHKPTLSKVYRPLRLHNFDGFVEHTQTERMGEGWTETYQRDFHTTITKHFFIVD